MFTRSEIRYACFRAKNNTITPEVEPVLRSIEQHVGQVDWSTFGQQWDVLSDKAGNIVKITPETNETFIHSTCLEKQLFVKHNVQPDDSWTAKKQNVIMIVESSMLDGLMSWETYNIKWGVEVDPVLKTIKTKLFRAPIQKEVTEEMIAASSQPKIVPPVIEVVPEIELEMKPASEQEKNAVMTFLSRKPRKSKGTN